MAAAQEPHQSAMQDLLDAMGLSKSSFYEFFGSKHDAFMAALRRYGDREVAKLDATVCSGGCARRLIEIQHGSLAAIRQVAVSPEVVETLVRGLPAAGGDTTAAAKPTGLAK